jgi:hypothetical protein
MSPIASPSSSSNKSDTNPIKPLRNGAHFELNSTDSSNKSSNNYLEPIIESNNSVNITPSVEISEYVETTSNNLVPDHKPVNISSSINTSVIDAPPKSNTFKAWGKVGLLLNKPSKTNIDKYGLGTSKSDITGLISNNSTSTQSDEDIGTKNTNSSSETSKSAWGKVSLLLNKPTKKNIDKYGLGTSKSEITEVISNNSNQPSNTPNVDIAPVPKVIVTPSISVEDIATNNNKSAWGKVSVLLNKPSKKNIDKYGLGASENAKIISNNAQQLTESFLKSNESINSQLSTVSNLANTNDITTNNTNNYNNNNNINTNTTTTNATTRNRHLSNASLAATDSKQIFHKNGTGLAKKIRSSILTPVLDNELSKVDCEKKVTNQDEVENINNICNQISSSEKLKVALKRIKDVKNNPVPIINIVANEIDNHKENLPTSTISNTVWDSYLSRNQPVSLSNAAINNRQMNLDKKHQSLIYQLKLEEMYQPETLLILSNKIKDNNDENINNASIVAIKKFKIKVPTSLSVNNNYYKKKEIVSEINEIKGISMGGYLYKKNYRGVYKRRYVTLSSENKYNQSLSNSMEGFNACYLRIYSKNVSSIWGDISIGLKSELLIKDIVQITTDTKSKGKDFNIEFYANDMNIIDEDDGVGDEEDDISDGDGDKKSESSHVNISSGNSNTRKLKFKADDATERFTWVSWIESAIELEKV